MSDDRGGEFLAGVVLGSLVGAAVALLLTPQRGDETRAQLREKGIEVRERMIELSDEARKAAEQLQEEGRASIGAQVARVEEAVEEGKKAASRKKQELLEELQD